MNNSLNLKINPIREYLVLNIYPIKPLAGLFFLSRSRETIPLPPRPPPPAAYYVSIRSTNSDLEYFNRSFKEL
jgi:hypothetical protein